MKIFKHIMLYILSSSVGATIISVISGWLFDVNAYALILFISCPLIVSLFFLYFKSCRHYPDFGLTDYLLVGINTVLPTSFLSCYLFYYQEAGRSVSRLFFSINSDFLFVSTATFVIVSIFGLIAVVVFSSFIIKRNGIH